MKMTGHKTEAVYRRYAIVDEAMLIESGAKLQTLHTRSNALGERRLQETSSRCDVTVSKRVVEAERYEYDTSRGFRA